MELPAFTRRSISALAFGIFALLPSLLQADITLSWDPTSDPSVVGYRLYSGTSTGVYTQTTEAGAATSLLVSNLSPGKTYYFAVTGYNSSAVESSFSNQVSYTAPSSSPSPTPTATPTATASPSPTITPSPTPKPSPGQMLNPVPGSTLGSSTVTFNWSAGTATTYSLQIGSSPGMSDIYSSGSITSPSATVNHLPTNGRTIYVSLWSLVNKAWSGNKYTYTAASPTPSPTPTPSPSATPTPSPTPSATATPSPSASATPTPSPTSTPSITPNPSATPTPSPTPGATATPTPSVSPTATPSASPTPTPAPSHVQGSGTINGPTGAEVSFNMNVQLQKLKRGRTKTVGSFSYSDATTALSVSTAKISGLTINGNQAQFTTTAKIGKTRLTLTISVTDNAQSGTPDTFSIQGSNGLSAGGSLVSGDITIN